MKSYFSTFILSVLFSAFYFTSIAQDQLQNLSKNFHENVEPHNQFRTAKPHVLYSPSALDSFILAKMDQYHFPGIQACIVKDDQIIWKGDYGYANIEENRLVTDSTLFILCSVSKPVTATALMQLWEDGLFGLDDDINNYLPFQVRNPSNPNHPITFRMLLTHTSSIYDNWDNLTPLRKWGEDDSPIALDSFLVNYLVPGGLYYNSFNYSSIPGTRFEYTNVGTALIGYLVERISTNSFEKYCQDSIFVPLRMNEASWFLANLDTNNIAMEYDYNGGSYFPYGHRGSPWYPAVRIRTSAIQLSRFLRAFIQMGQIDGIRILDGSTVDLMTTVQNPAIDPFGGFIWGIQEIYIPYVGTRTSCGHLGGGNYGATTIMGYTLETGENVGAIVMANGGSQDGIWDIWMELMAYGLLYNKIYAQNVELNSSFMKVNEDTLTLNTEFVNPNNHNFSANAIITSIDKVYNDSIPLYDDGKHDDFQVGDGIWGNYIPSTSIENEFMVGFSTTDLVSGSHLVQNSQVHFTTIGPISVKDFYPIIKFSSDSLTGPGHTILYKISIYNDGQSAQAENVTVKLISTDSLIKILAPNKITFGDIEPGALATSSKYFSIICSDICPDSAALPLTFEVYSKNYHYWTDKTRITDNYTSIEEDQKTIPLEFTLYQNYPNPFNLITTIEYQLPQTGQVDLSIYNILGQKVTTLVSEKQPAGSYNVKWDATDFASGVYLYRLETNRSFMSTRKLVLLR